VAAFFFFCRVLICYIFLIGVWRVFSFALSVPLFDFSAEGDVFQGSLSLSFRRFFSFSDRSVLPYALSKFFSPRH